MDFWGCGEEIRGKGKGGEEGGSDGFVLSIPILWPPSTTTTTKSRHHHGGIISTFFKTQIRSWWIIINEMLYQLQELKSVGLLNLNSI